MGYQSTQLIKGLKEANKIDTQDEMRKFGRIEYVDFDMMRNIEYICAAGN